VSKKSIIAVALDAALIAPLHLAQARRAYRVREGAAPSGKELATPDRKIGKFVVHKGRMTDLRDAAARGRRPIEGHHSKAAIRKSGVPPHSSQNRNSCCSGR
jgi:hypothetical protein